MPQNKRRKKNPFVGTWIHSNPYLSEVEFTIAETSKGITVKARDPTDGEIAKISKISAGARYLSFVAHWPSTGRVTQNRIELSSTNCVTLTFSYSEQVSLIRRGKDGPLIDEDGEVRELTARDFKKFRPADEVLSPELFRNLKKHRGGRKTRQKVLRGLNDIKKGRLSSKSILEIGDEK